MASSTTSKPDFVTDFSEFDSIDEERAAKSASLVAKLDALRLGMIALAIVSAIAVLGTAGDSLATYHKTALGSGYIISLWPNEFDIRPTTAIVACSVVVLVSSIISLVGFKVSAIRNNRLLNAGFSIGLPIISLIAALVASSFFYGVNTSNTNHSLQSWSCQWSPIQMDTKPHWGTLCKESKAALYLTVMWIPLEIIVLGAAMFGNLKGGHKSSVVSPVLVEKKESPALS